MSIPGVGDYEILSEAGRGAMGVVYRAVDRRTGEPIAIKQVRTPTSALSKVLRREISALSILDHPGVVRILASGVGAQGPWMAMRWIDGPTLRDIAGSSVDDSTLPEGSALQPRSDFAAAPTLPIAEVLRIGRALAETLSYVHGRGLAHRDLKPSNVILAGGNAPVLIDFGLTTGFGADSARERLEIGAGRAGTAAYLAPEVLAGRAVDARADLYALGCTLFELLVGRPPFVGPTTALDAQHARAKVPRASAQRAEVPPHLDDLLVALLDKRPERRPAYALDVVKALSDLGAAPTWDGAPAGRAYLHPPALTGRDRELERLKAAGRAAVAGEPVRLAVVGEQGVGKTRLCVEALRAARAGGLATVAVPAHAGPSVPLQSLQPLLQTWADRARAGRVDPRALAPDAAAAIAGWLPELLGAAARHRGVDRRAARADAVRAIVRQLAQTGPVAVVFDDLHDADEASRDAIAALWHSGGIPGALLACTWAAESETDDLARLRSAPGAIAIRLDGLAGPAVGGMVSQMLGGTKPPESLIRSLVEASQGNPLYAAEYLNAAMEDGRLFRADDGTWRAPFDPAEVVGRPPERLLEMVARHLSTLGGQAREAMIAAGFLGRQVDEDEVRAMTGADEATHAAAIQELVRRGVLGEVGEGLRFRNGVLVDGAVSLAEDPHARHRAAARALREVHAAEVQPHLIRIAHHLAGSNDPDGAAIAYEEAHEDSVMRFALDRAEAACRGWLALPDRQPRQWIEWMSKLASVLVSAGDTGGAMQALDQARAAASELGDPSSMHRVLHTLGIATYRSGHLAAAETLVREALSLQQMELARHRPATCTLLGNILAQRGSLEEASTWHERALALTPEPTIARLARTNLAIVRHSQGRLGEAASLAETGRAEASAAGQPALAAAMLGLAAASAQDRGDLERALELSLQTLAERRSIGNRRGQAISHLNLGRLYTDLGDLEQGERHSRDAMSLIEAVGDAFLRAVCLGCDGRIRAARGEVESGRALLAQAVAALRDLGERVEALDCEIDLLALAGGDEDVVADATRLAAEAHEMGARLLEARARALIPSGRPEALRLARLCGVDLDGRSPLALRLTRPRGDPRP